MNAQTLMIECTAALDIVLTETGFTDEMSSEEYVEFRRGYTLGFVLGRGTRARRTPRGKNMKDWQGFNLDDVAEYVTDDEVRWWLLGYADRSAAPNTRAPPEGDEASSACVRAYRAGLGLDVRSP